MPQIYYVLQRKHTCTHTDTKQQQLLEGFSETASTAEESKYVLSILYLTLGSSLIQLLCFSRHGKDPWVFSCLTVQHYRCSLVMTFPEIKL